MLYNSKQLRVLAKSATATSCLSLGQSLQIAQKLMHRLTLHAATSPLKLFRFLSPTIPHFFRLLLYWTAHLQGYDLIEDMYSAKTAAMNLVAELCKQRGKASLEPFMHFIVQVMTEYQVAYLTSPSSLSP